MEAKGVSWALSTKIERDPVRGILKISQEDVNSLLRDHGLEEIGEEETPTYEKDPPLCEADLPVSEEDKKEVSSFPT